MYELVNTSVPNGLIPGTHGFATVAMTKGMPDAIRTRVEGLCTYPHRSSAHDESYYRENPVNWFHLTLPSGDHVVGRTMPADFDYTGRTNRLARAIFLRRGEMPVSGGCEAIRIAGPHLTEKWSGEPRMLPADKVLAAKFFALERSNDVPPANWMALFGDKGISLAKRFAMLVCRNVMSGGRSVYFKTSTAWDVDGTRLLGLFADIINLLPDDIVPLVTFATFSACVPSGVVCHLRGVYDKDKAFEFASATQPWVDCERGRVIHEELLPSVPVTVPQNGTLGEQVSASTVKSAGLKLGVHRNPEAMAERASRVRENRWQDFIPHESDSDKTFYTVLGSLALLVMLVAGCIWWGWDRSSSRTSTSDVDPRMGEMNAGEEEEKEPSSSPHFLHAERNKQEEESATNKEAKEAEKTETVDSKVKVDEEAKNAVKAIVREVKDGDKNDFDALRKAREQNLNLRLDKLKITQVFSETDNVLGVSNFFEIATADLCKSNKLAKVNHVLAIYADILTNENSVVVYYLENGSVKQESCKYSARPVKSIGRSSAKMKFTAERWPAAANNSPWIVCRVVNPTWCKDGDPTSLDVFWWWNKIPEQRLFAGDDKTVNLKEICFGSDEAKMLYKDHYGKVYYWLEWGNDVYIQEEDDTRIAYFCGTNELNRLTKYYDEKIEEIKKKITEKKKRRDSFSSGLDAIQKGKAEKDNIDQGKGFGKLTKDDKKKKKNQIDKEVVNKIKSLDQKYYKLQPTGIDTVERDLKNEQKTLKNEIEGMESRKVKLEEEKKEKCNKDKLKDDVKKRKYRVRAIDAIPDRMGLGMNKHMGKGVL